jgi:RHS repeat-associated protein
MQSCRETLLCRYHYDPLDRLVASTPLVQGNVQRYYLKDRLSTEVQGAVQRSIMQHDDQLLAQQQCQRGALETHLLVTDQQRSVLNVLGATQQHTLAYTPYGHRISQNGLLSLLGFNGERPDPVTGWYLLGNGYRAFNPVLMQFNSPDSWSPFGKGGLNAYAYCVGDPINKHDRTGHISQWVGVLLDKGKRTFSRSIVKLSRRKLKTPTGATSTPRTIQTPSIDELTPPSYDSLFPPSYNAAVPVAERRPLLQATTDFKSEAQFKIQRETAKYRINLSQLVLDKFPNIGQSTTTPFANNSPLYKNINSGQAFTAYRDTHTASLDNLHQEIHSGRYFPDVLTQLNENKLPGVNIYELPETITNLIRNG